MLFNSVEFIFGFLPVTALVFFGLARWSHPAAAAWMAFASLFFYGWWNWTYVPLLVASAAFNYACGARLARCRASLKKPFEVAGIFRAALDLGWADWLAGLVPGRLLFALTRPH